MLLSHEQSRLSVQFLFLIFPLLFGVIILFQFNSHFASFEFSLSFTTERFRTVVTIKGPFSLVNHSFAFIIFFSFLCRTKDLHDNTDLSYPS